MPLQLLELHYYAAKLTLKLLTILLILESKFPFTLAFGCNQPKCTNRIIPIDAETDLSPPSEIVVKSEAATADPNRTIR